MIRRFLLRWRSARAWADFQAEVRRARAKAVISHSRRRHIDESQKAIVCAALAAGLPTQALRGGQ